VAMILRSGTSIREREISELEVSRRREILFQLSRPDECLSRASGDIRDQETRAKCQHRRLHADNPGSNRIIVHNPFLPDADRADSFH